MSNILTYTGGFFLCTALFAAMYGGVETFKVFLITGSILLIVGGVL